MDSVTSNHKIRIGQGWVMHARPDKSIRNAFRYNIFNIVLPIKNTEVIPLLLKKRFLSLKSEDYLDGTPIDLQTKIQSFLKENLHYTCDQIYLQTLPRMFGYAFNPVSFWFCYRKEKLDAVLCEVNNTFGEKHFYFVKPSTRESAKLEKKFHVSPFFPVSGSYEFDFELTRNISDVKIRLYENQELKLDTRIYLKLKDLDEVSGFNLLKTYGWMTPLIVFRIHWQALRLWAKGATFFSKPIKPNSNLTSREKSGL